MARGRSRGPGRIAVDGERERPDPAVGGL